MRAMPNCSASARMLPMYTMGSSNSAAVGRYTGASTAPRPRCDMAAHAGMGVLM